MVPLRQQHQSTALLVLVSAFFLVRTNLVTTTSLVGADVGVAKDERSVLITGTVATKQREERDDLDGTVQGTMGVPDSLDRGILESFRVPRPADHGDDAISKASYLTRYASSCKNREAPPRLVTIRGERHSGTNLVRVLIDQNAVDLMDSKDHVQRAIRRRNSSVASYNYTAIDVDAVYGWKHGFLRHSYPNDQILPSDVLLVVTRDVFSWIISMFHQPYNFKMTRGMEHFDEFLRGHYSAKCELHAYYHGCKFPMEEATHLVQIRTAKYKNWLMHRHGSSSDGKISNCTWDVIRYESLTAEGGMERTMLSFFHRQSIDHTVTFQNVDGHVTWSKTPNRKTFRGKPREYYLSKYTTDQIRFVLSNLDLGFEKHILNYTYDYVDAYIRQREDGTTNASSYAGPPVLAGNGEKSRKQLIEHFEMAARPRPRTNVQVVRRVANSSKMVRQIDAEQRMVIQRGLG